VFVNTRPRSSNFSNTVLPATLGNSSHLQDEILQQKIGNAPLSPPVKTVVSPPLMCASPHRRQSLELRGNSSPRAGLRHKMCPSSGARLSKIPGRVESGRGMKSMGRGTRRHLRASRANGPGGGNNRSPPTNSTATWKRREESRRTDRGTPRTHSQPPVCGQLQCRAATKSCQVGCKCAAGSLTRKKSLPTQYSSRGPFASVWPLLLPCSSITGLSRFTATTDAGIPVESRLCLGSSGSSGEKEKKQGEPGSWSLEPSTAGRFPFSTGVV